MPEEQRWPRSSWARQGGDGRGSSSGAGTGAMRRQSPGDAAASPGIGSGPGGTRQGMVAIAGTGGPTSCPRSTLGHDSHGDVGLGTGRAGGGSRVSAVPGEPCPG